MLLARQPEALQDLTEALGVYDNRELLDKEHMYKRFNPQVMSNPIYIKPVYVRIRYTYMPIMLFNVGCKPCLDIHGFALQRPDVASQESSNS